MQPKGGSIGNVVQFKVNVVQVICRWKGEKSYLSRAETGLDLAELGKWYSFLNIIILSKTTFTQKEQWQHYTFKKRIGHLSTLRPKHCVNLPYFQTQTENDPGCGSLKRFRGWCLLTGLVRWQQETVQQVRKLSSVQAMRTVEEPWKRSLKQNWITVRISILI